MSHLTKAQAQLQGAIADIQRALQAIEGMRKVLAVKQAVHDHTVAVATAARAALEAEVRS